MEPGGIIRRERTANLERRVRETKVHRTYISPKRLVGDLLWAAFGRRRGEKPVCRENKGDSQERKGGSVECSFNEKGGRDWAFGDGGRHQAKEKGGNRRRNMAETVFD